ncbi:apolipo protein O-domain-containing protein, partial [Naematelia encephala]
RLLQLSAAPSAAIVGAATYSTLTSKAARAEEYNAPSTASLSAIKPGRTQTGDKLPIYPSEDLDAPVQLIETPHPLSPYIARARESTTSLFGGASEQVESGVKRWIGFERRVEHEVKQILPRDEPLTPGIIYVLIAGLSGSVLTRTRSFPIRWLTPPLLTLAAMPYFLPKTSHNIRQYLSDVEDHHFPAFAAEHDRIFSTAVAHSQMTLDRLGGLRDKAREAAEKAGRKVEDATGLKVGDVVSRIDREKERLEAASEQQLSKSGQKMEVVGYVVEQKPIAEIVAPVQ